jgi:hypothetical protein
LRGKYNAGDRIKVIDRDLMIIEASDFIWLNAPKLKEMYKREEEDKKIEMRIRKNPLRYDPRFAYTNVVALGLARCFVPCIVTTNRWDAYTRLKVHFFNLESDIYNLNKINIIWYRNLSKAANKNLLRKKLKNMIFSTK